MRAWPLRVRLVVVVVVLVTAALTASGVAAVTLLRSYLFSQVDTQLVEVARSPNVAEQLAQLDSRSAAGLDRRSVPEVAGTPNQPPQPGTRPPLPSEFFVALADAQGDVLASAGSSFTSVQPELPTMDAATVATQAGIPFTVPSEGSGPQWRVLAVPNSLGSTIVAREIGDVESTVGRLTVVMIAIGGAIVVVVAVVAYLLIRRNLAPLAEVEAAAVAIAGGDMSRRVPAAAPGTEVGEMSMALNTMLGRLETAISAREVAVQEAQASEQRMRSFVADASHELRTPLTAVGGYAELFRQGAIPADEVPRAFDRIEGEAARMTELVDDLLLLARLDQHRPLAQRRIDLIALVSDRVAGFAAAFPQTPVEVTVAQSPAPPEVIGDPARLGQVLTNLLTNAAKHGSSQPQQADQLSRSAPVTVEIGLTDSQWVTVRVVDHGPGVADGDKERIFTRFVRGDASRTRGSGGSGLGLSIVAAIVAAHGGAVSVGDTPGGGATFTVRLPTAPAQ